MPSVTLTGASEACTAIRVTARRSAATMSSSTSWVTREEERHETLPLELSLPRILKPRERCRKNFSQGFKNKEDTNFNLFPNLGEIQYRGGGKNNAQEESEIQKGIRLLREEIKNLNEPLWIQDITMDGNCLYRAIADQLEND